MLKFAYWSWNYIATLALVLNILGYNVIYFPSMKIKEKYLLTDYVQELSLLQWCLAYITNQDFLMFKPQIAEGTSLFLVLSFNI